MQECHNNHFKLFLLSTTISRRFEQETQKWEKNILPDLTYFLTIDSLEV